MLNLSETCVHLHRPLSSSPRLTDRLKLVIKFTSGKTEFATFGRKYRKIKMICANEALHDANVRDLDFYNRTFTLQDLNEFFGCFDNVEKLTLVNIHVDDKSSVNKAQSFLPNLKELQMKGSRSSLLFLFHNVTKLVRFKFHNLSRSSETLDYGVRNFEDFNLKLSMQINVFLTLPTLLVSFDIKKACKPSEFSTFTIQEYFLILMIIDTCSGSSLRCLP